MERTASPRTIDDFSAMLKPLSEGMWEYEKSSSNGCLISEASLKEMLTYLSNVTFSIISPIVPEDNVSNNVERLASFRTSVQGVSIPLYHIVGQWLGEGSDTASVDKGYILVKPKHMPMERFAVFMQQAVRTYGLDAFVIKASGEEIICKDKKGNTIRRFSGSFSIDLLEKAYSFRLLMNKRLSFIGLEIPNGSIMSFRLFKGSGVEYYLPEGFLKRKKVK